MGSSISFSDVNFGDALFQVRCFLTGILFYLCSQCLIFIKKCRICAIKITKNHVRNQSGIKRVQSISTTISTNL